MMSNDLQHDLPNAICFLAIDAIAPAGEGTVRVACEAALHFGWDR